MGRRMQILWNFPNLAFFFFEFRLIMRYLKTKPIVCVSFWNFKMAWTWCQANPAWRSTGRCYAPFPIGHISFSFCPIYWPVTWPVFYVLVRDWMSPVLLMRYTAKIFWAVSKGWVTLVVVSELLAHHTFAPVWGRYLSLSHK